MFFNDNLLICFVMSLSATVMEGRGQGELDLHIIYIYIYTSSPGAKVCFSSPLFHQIEPGWVKVNFQQTLCWFGRGPPEQALMLTNVSANVCFNVKKQQQRETDFVGV